MIKGNLYRLSWRSNLMETIPCYVVRHLCNNEYVCIRDTCVVPRGNPVMVIDPAPYIYEDEFHADCRLAMFSNEDYVVCLFDDMLIALYADYIEPLVVYYCNSAVVKP
jgi:hypothetical protein